MFKIKDHLRIIVFLITIKTSVLIKFKSMEDLENNNWIILDSLGNIFELYANVTVMTTLLNLNTL